MANPAHGITTESGVHLDSTSTARLQAQFSTGKQNETRLIINEVNEKKALNQGYTPKATVFFKNNKDSMYNVDLPCTKVLIEGCSNCVITFKNRIHTEVVEMWNCTGITLNIEVAKVKTLQIDMCTGITLNYADKKNFSQIIWAGVRDMNITVGKGKNADTWRSDFDEIVQKDEFKDMSLSDKTDQFYVRYIKNKLKEELMVRLDNGFPTTEREAADFDRKKEENDKRFEEHVRQMLSSKNSISEALKDVTKVETVKAKRNDPCPCGSGKKYKSCCIDLPDADFQRRLEENKRSLALAEEEAKRKLEAAAQLGQKLAEQLVHPNEAQAEEKKEEEKEEEKKE